MASKKGKAWKMERASVSLKEDGRPRSNKYSGSDSQREPRGSRKKVWVGGYTRSDGSQVPGYYRSGPSS